MSNGLGDLSYAPSPPGLDPSSEIDDPCSSTSHINTKSSPKLLGINACSDDGAGTIREKLGHLPDPPESSKTLESLEPAAELDSLRYDRSRPFWGRDKRDFNRFVALLYYNGIYGGRQQ